MFLVWFMFIVAIVLPFGLKLADLPRNVANPIMYLIGGVVLAIIAVSVGWRMLTGRGRERRVRVPDPTRILRLRWPSDLSQPELDAYCTAYLRAQGWSVAPVVSNEAEGEFLEVKRQDTHVLLRCDTAKDLPRPALVRGVALAATGFPGARPAILRQSRAPFPSATVAAARAVRALLLYVSDLPRLAEMAAADPVPPPEAAPEPAMSAGAAPRR